MSTQVAFDLAVFRRATEERDAETLIGLYAQDAEVRVVDQHHPPKSPQVLRGAAEIRSWIDDTCSRDLTHKVVTPVVGDGRIAVTTECRYPDGTNVFCACTATLADGLIATQQVIQVWDQ